MPRAVQQGAHVRLVSPCDIDHQHAYKKDYLPSFCVSNNSTTTQKCMRFYFRAALYITNLLSKYQQVLLGITVVLWCYIQTSTLIVVQPNES